MRLSVVYIKAFSLSRFTSNILLEYKVLHCSLFFSQRYLEYLRTSY